MIRIITFICIQFTNVIITANYNGCSLSGSRIFINPDLKEAYDLRLWWDDEGSLKEDLQIIEEVKSSTLLDFSFSISAKVVDLRYFIL